MKKLLIATLVVAFATVLDPAIPDVSLMLGVSAYTAKLVVKAIFLGLSKWTILKLIIAGAGIAAIAIGSLSYLVKRLGRKAAVAW